jgi:hypothetical protein
MLYRLPVTQSHEFTLFFIYSFILLFVIWLVYRCLSNHSRLLYFNMTVSNIFKRTLTINL